jgi:hypothetical protein
MTVQPQALIGREQSNATLNTLMRGELIAVETYRHAITTVTGEVPLDLNRCLTSHDLRAVRLAEHITLSGGTPITGNGLWSACARIFSGGATMIGRSTLLAALEDGESQVLCDYRAALPHVDGAGTMLLRNDLLPEQVRILGIVNHLFRRSDR